LEEIWFTNGGASLTIYKTDLGNLPIFCVTIVKRATTAWLISKQLPSFNSKILLLIGKYGDRKFTFDLSFQSNQYILGEMNPDENAISGNKKSNIQVSGISI
jgi:hypothetical protein